MYQSVCLISEERNECVIATEVSAGLAALPAWPCLPLGGWESGLVTPDLSGHSGWVRTLPGQARFSGSWVPASLVETEGVKQEPCW